MSSRGPAQTRADGGVRINAEWDDAESIVRTILRCIAVIEDEPVETIGPLYEHIEPEAMTTLLRHENRGDEHVGIEFVVDDYTVVVTNDETVSIHDGAPATAQDPNTPTDNENDRK